MTDNFHLQSYFRRIGYTGAASPDLSTLIDLHARHVSEIPFENLDPLTGRAVRLDLPALQEKLVASRRGGYCFEQNLLFKAALEALGFKVTGLAARVRWMAPPDRPLGARSHMLLRVDLPEGPYLADVGFGGQLLDAPLRLVPDIEQETAAAHYRLASSDGVLSLATRLPTGWQVMYLFTLEPQVQADYEMGNWFTSTHPQMWFRKRLLVERVNPEVRYTLSNLQLVERRRRGAQQSERTLANAAEFSKTLDELFGLSPPVPADPLYARLAAN
jgi:N-hydroxyarylamine O-acetyltransferase